MDPNPGDGVCETAPGNGICTLRAAIQETNALAGDDTIILAPNTYVPNSFVSHQYPNIAGNLTITGSGASTTTIEGDLKGGGVLGINAGFTVNVSGVTIGSQTIGQAIGNEGTLTLSDSTVSNVGGGIYNSGTLTLVNSTVSRNFAGLIGAAGIDNIGTATLINSTVIANSAQGSHRPAAASPTAAH